LHPRFRVNSIDLPTRAALADVAARSASSNNERVRRID
jgi:hypothetical protein